MSGAWGLDIGGSTLRVGFVDASGVLRDVERRPIAEKRLDVVLDTLQEMQRLLANRLNIDPRDFPAGVGVASSVVRGILVLAPALGWEGADLRSLARRRFGEKTRVLNDLNAIAMGEMCCGAGVGCSDGMVVFLGTGIGMGVVVNGELFEGAWGAGTEIGHVTVDTSSHARRCGCGRLGCLEAYAGGGYLADRVMAIADKDSCLYGLSRETINAWVVEKAVQAGDRVAIAMWEETAALMGLAVANAIMLFNPEILILGGGVLESAPSLFGRIKDHILATTHIAQREGLRIVESTLGDRAGLIGAALGAMKP